MTTARLSRTRRETLRRLAALVVLPSAVWFQTLFFDFSYHDDDMMVIHNAARLQEGFRLDTIFCTDAWLHTGEVELYRPWQTLTFIADHAMWGLDPRGYHLHNLVVFLAGGLALFVLLRRLFPRGDTALWAAGLYQVNPLFSHAVSWLPARGDLYLFAFSMLCLRFLLDCARRQTPRRMLLAAIFFLLALLAKETALALLPVGYLIIYRARRRLSPTPAALGCLAFVAAGLSVYLRLRASAVASASLETSPAAWLRGAAAILEQSAKLFAPVGYSVMPRVSAPLTLAGLGAVALLGWSLFRLRARLRLPVIGLGLALWLASYLPALAYRARFTGHAYDYLDHRAYFCLAGLWIVAAELARATAVPRRLARPLAAGAAAFFAVASLVLAGTYRDWRAYYENATTTNPASFLAAYNKGLLLVNERSYSEALASLERAKLLLPGNPEVRTRLAGVLIQLGRFEEALVEASLGVAAGNADLADAHLFRGVALLNTARAAEALPDLRAAAGLDPRDPQKWRFLGLGLRLTGELPGALEVLTRAIEQMPDQAQLYRERAACYGAIERPADARQDIETAARLEAAGGSARPGNAVH